MSGTGNFKKAKLYIGSKLVVACQAYDEKYNPNAEGHSDITTDKVTFHSTGLKEWSLDIEVDLRPGNVSVRPSDFDEMNPVDVVIIGVKENRRYVQGITTDVGVSFKKEDGEVLKFTLGHFKDMIFE